MNEFIKQIHRTFLNESRLTETSDWQSVEIDKRNPMYEQENLFFTYHPSGDEIKDIIEDLSPDLPWAEDHFQERVSGKPLNPGQSYKSWPYYNNSDELFRRQGIFSHTYMERFWPTHATQNESYTPVPPDGELKRIGIRYPYGDLHDLIDRLKNKPNTRQAFFSIWHPEDQSNNDVRVPCTIGYWFKKDGSVLNMTYLIRSCDLVRHFRNDLYLSYRLLQWVCNQLNLQPWNLTVWIGSLHCFQSDFYHIKKLTR